MLAVYCMSDVGKPHMCYHHHHCHKHHDIDQLLQVTRWRSDLGKRHMACSADSHRCQPLLTHPRISPHSFGIHNCLGEGHEMARGGNPTVVFNSKRRQVSWDIPTYLFFCTFLSLCFLSSKISTFQVVLQFNRGTSDPDGDGNFDCIPAVDNFQVSLKKAKKTG